LTFAIKKIPLSIVYASWAGIGVLLIAILGYFFYKQTLSWQAIFGLVVLLLIFTLSMVSLSSKNSALKVQLEQEKVVTLSLLKLQDKVFYLKLSNAKSKKIIQRTYQRTKNKSIHIQSNNQIVLSGFSMPFSDVLNGLKR
jgi:MFS family permease